LKVGRKRGRLEDIIGGRKEEREVGGNNRRSEGRDGGWRK